MGEVAALQKVTKLFRQGLTLVKPCWLSLINSVTFIYLDVSSRRNCSMILLGMEMRLTSQLYLFKNGHDVSLFPVYGNFA